ncbi:MAG TPA: PKD domain-containing protein [Bacteroidales bacterium]
MKLAVGDASDAAYDTGVYLEKGSFDPGKVSEETVYSHPTIDSILYESCNNHEAVLYFGIGSYRNSVYKLPFTVIGTATRNVDYTIQSTHAGDTIYIPVGRLYDSLIIRTFADGVDEGIENIGIRYNPVMCGFGNPDTAFVYISDLIPIVDTAIYYSMYCQDTITLGFTDVARGVPPYSFDWYTLGKTTPTVNFIPSGADNFLIPCVVYDTCGQQISDTAIIVIPDLVTDAGPNQDLCNQPSAQLSGSSPGAQAFWWTSAPVDPSLAGQESIPNPVVSPTVTTAYTLTATDNCTNSDDDVTNVLLDGASANAGPDELICINETVQLTCNIGATGEDYTWTSVPADPSLIGQENQQTINVSPTVTTVYTVNLINECGYTASDDIEVEVTPLPIASAGPDDNICFGQTYQLNASGGSHFKWTSIPIDPSLSVNGQDTLANPIVSPPTQEPYTYSVQVWDMCANSASMTLSVDPVPNITVSADNPTTCYGSPVVISAGGTPANYVWTADPYDQTLEGQENNQTITVTPLVTTTYTLVGVVAGFSCPATVEQTVVVKEELFATFETQATTVCENDAFTVLYTGNASPSAIYTWDFDGAAIISGSGAGPYDLSWTGMGAKNISLSVNDGGCLSEPYSSGLTVLQSPQTAFSANLQQGCAPYTVEFTNNTSNESSSVTYSWDFGVAGGTSSQASPSFTYSTPGSYTVSLTVTNNGQCANKLTEAGFIEVNDTPVSEFTPNPTETLLEDATINFINTSSSIDNLTYEWDFGDGGSSTEIAPNHTYTSQGTFLVNLIVTTAAGCENESTQEVTVFPNFAVYAPSAFTPNGDGKNDLFEVKGIGIKNYHLQIYSRWGELIYESFNLEEMWDGKVDGTLVESATYAFLIKYQSMLGKDADVKGTVTVMY